jgi:2-oxo-4-hydroxy-4-carboxy-5-ureidoimidazoline decarboxylase
VDGSTAPGVVAFNRLPDDAGHALLSACLHAEGWAGAVLAGRPYPDRESLLATAYRFGAVLEEDDLKSALAAHPRIGDRPAGTAGAASRREQGGVDADDADLAARLTAGNLAYEERFGHVFLIRAAGRSGPQILEALAARLLNDPDAEARVVREQLAQIAQLRLDDALTVLAEA